MEIPLLRGPVQMAIDSTPGHQRKASFQVNQLKIFALIMLFTPLVENSLSWKVIIDKVCAILAGK